MTYTETEKRMMLDHMEKIKAYLLENAPQLRDKFEIAFRDEYNYYLTVTNYDETPRISGWIGRNLGVSWDRPESKREESIYNTERDAICNYCMIIIKNWQQIKTALADEIERQENAREILANFTI